MDEPIWDLVGVAVEMLLGIVLVALLVVAPLVGIGYMIVELLNG